MCGIAVIANPAADTRGVLATLDIMHRDLAARGPDGEGVLLVDRDLRPHRFDSMPSAIGQPPVRLSIAAAFRRLAVRDLRPEAGLPLAMSQGRRWILHNGELYNDAELRRELAALGASFATTNDAETILAAYAFWGEACFERLRGMWAVVIVDLEGGRLVVSRDRLGIKPLFYAETDGGLLLASHPRAIARALRPALDRRRWHRFLRGLPADTPRETFFAGVHAVPAGAIASIDLRAPATSVRFRQFWSLDGCVAVEDGQSDASRSDELLALLEGATREQLQSDRRIGCLLSGGLDSSLVACLAARAPGAGRLTCLSIVFDDPRMSEWPYIRMVAAHAGAESVCHRLTTGEVWGLTDDVIVAHGEPLLGQDAIAHYRAFQLAREQDCAVALEGQGADEIFAGLPAYENIMFLEWLTSGAWMRLLDEARIRARAQGHPLWRSLRRLVLGPAVRRWIRPVRRTYDWLTPDDSREIEPPVERSADPSMLNRFLFDLVRHTNLPAVLAIQDRNAMAHGVENRPPFVDHRIVEWAFRRPASAKVGGGLRKRVLHQAARTVVPSGVLARTDKRAIVSRHDWMPLRANYRPDLEQLAQSARLRQAPLIDGDRMAAFVRDYLRGSHDDGMAVWRLHTASRWLEHFQPA